MRNWIDRLFLLALLLIVAALALTAIPAVPSGPLSGSALLLHMMASGALVFVLPLYAVVYVGRNLRRDRSSGMQRAGFWMLLASGVLTIGSIFLCMLPIASTEQMHELIGVHRYAGFAMVPAVALLAMGVSRWRRIHATRSATPG